MSVRGSSAHDELVALRRETFKVDLGQNGDFHLVSGHHAESFVGFGAIATDLLAMLTKEFVAPAEIERLGAEHGARLLDQLRNGGWLNLGVSHGGPIQYALEPLSSPPPRGDLPDDLVLSRFAVIHRDGAEILIESPLAWCDIRLIEPAALGVVARLATGSNNRLTDDELGGSLRADLWWGGFLVEPDAEHTALATRQWSLHELWFHEHSRGGHRSYSHHGFGRTRWADGIFPQLPARTERTFDGPRIALARADLTVLRTTDPTLTTVIEDRSTIRRHDDENPLTLDELGQFLYRCARTRAIATSDGVEYKSRPYPAGGGAYELEIYPVVRNVVGLAPGMYHYNAEDHELVLVAEDGPPTSRILRRSRLSSQQETMPQVLLVVTARFGRLMWTYEAMAYALILKHVGVLYQTMYLIATAMGIAACGLGSGDNVHFAAATGIDPLVEDNVGEFMLGRPHAATERIAR